MGVLSSILVVSGVCFAAICVGSFLIMITE